MYKLDEVIVFIERKQNIKLFDYQKRMLKYMIEGSIFFVPRRSGRTTVLEGYISYLRSIQDKHWTWDADEHIGLNEVMNENKHVVDDTYEFREIQREYDSAWINESK